jgi:DNA-binding CsgD family transcriptional regulator
MLRLSPRQMELLRCAARGLTIHEAAHELGMSPHTARSHWREIYAKFEGDPQCQKLSIERSLELRSRWGVLLAALFFSILSFSDVFGVDYHQRPSA